jgi:hypothetical protein
MFVDVDVFIKQNATGGKHVCTDHSPGRCAHESGEPRDDAGAGVCLGLAGETGNREWVLDECVFSQSTEKCARKAK